MKPKTQQTLVWREKETLRHVSASDRQSTGQTLVNWSNSGQNCKNG